MIIAIAKIHGDPGYLEPVLQTTLDGLCPQTMASPGSTALPCFSPAPGLLPASGCAEASARCVWAGIPLLES
jgi:hypothetical protein